MTGVSAEVELHDWPGKLADAVRMVHSAGLYDTATAAIFGPTTMSARNRAARHTTSCPLTRMCAVCVWPHAYDVGVLVGAEQADQGDEVHCVL